MKLLFQRTVWLVAGLSFFLTIAGTTSAQEDTTPKKRLRSPAVIKGNVGGESHDSYVIHAAKGKLMNVEISWMPEGDNDASFTVSESSNFFTAERIGFGHESKDGKRWSGRIPKTRNYHIYVVAHPVAKYKLRVTLK
jgi:hypothetical protein